MKSINTDTSVGEIVRAAPARSRVFEKLGIDYCCGGKKPLAEACQVKGLDSATVVAMLGALDGDAPAATSVDPDTMSLSALCDHIEHVHHGYLREELPRLDFMTRKVAAVHGEHEPRLAQVRQVFESLNATIVEHTRDEEENVFPAIRRLDLTDGTGDRAVGLSAALDKLKSEHDRTGAALARLHELTENYTPPEWACNTFRALYDGLAKLELDTHQHVHKENNVLFPRALGAN